MIRVLRSTSMRLAFGFAGLFIVASLLLVGLVWWRTAAYLDRETDAVILADTHAVADRLRDFGLLGAVAAIRDRTGASGDRNAIYLLIDPYQQILAGNLSAWPFEIGHTSGWYHADMLRNGQVHAMRVLNVGLAGGYQLLVGRDVQDKAQVRTLILNGLAWAIVGALVLAMLGGWFARRALLARLEAMRRTTAAIVQGDLTQRVPERASSDEFDQLARMINHMLDQIQLLIEGVRNVSNAVAHDLRTPLAEVRARLEDVLRSRSASEEVYGEIESAVEDLDRLIAMANALLRLAEIDSGVRRSGFRRVDLADLVTEVVDFYRPAAEAKSIDLSADAPAGIALNGDPGLLAQAVGNLVDNAIKYAPQQGKVAVRLAQHEDGDVTVAVTDNGPGIPEAEMAHVTERFYRGDSSRGVTGFGLGLSVVAAAARLHGGRVEFADNQPGLVATLVLPATIGQAPLAG
jgi:signal transduction histidine kinase